MTTLESNLNNKDLVELLEMQIKIEQNKIYDMNTKNKKNVEKIMKLMIEIEKLENIFVKEIKYEINKINIIEDNFQNIILLYKQICTNLLS